MFKETNVSNEHLRAVSGKFDLDTIFILELKDKGIAKLGSIPKCSGLVILNLSWNKLTSLPQIENLTQLAYLDLSFNLLTTFDGIADLTKLKSLKLIGNKIDRPKNLETKFKGMIALEKLYFQEINQNPDTANPICQMENYRFEMFKAFPNLKSLDGIRKDCECLVIPSYSLDDNKKLNPDSFNFNFNAKLDLNSFQISRQEELKALRSNLEERMSAYQNEISFIKNNFIK